MKIQLAMFAVLAAACTGDTAVKDSGSDTSSSGVCADPYTGPVSVDLATVDCDGDQVTFYAETTGWTDGGYVFSQETGNVEPQWSDEHTLVSFEHDDCGHLDKLHRTLDDGTTLSNPTEDWQENVSTVFQCGAHFGDDQVMTYAFAVDDTDGNLASCLAFGDDVNGMKNQTYDTVNSGPSFDLGICVAGDPVR